MLALAADGRRAVRRRARRVQQRRRGGTSRPVVRADQRVGVGDGRQLLGCRARVPGVPAPPRSAAGTSSTRPRSPGCCPGFIPSYDASKHAVVAISEDLYNMVSVAGLPIGVSVLCPGWVRTSIIDADRNWPAELGERPPDRPGEGVMRAPRRAGRSPRGAHRRPSPTPWSRRSPPTGSGSSRTRNSSTSPSAVGHDRRTRQPGRAGADAGHAAAIADRSPRCWPRSACRRPR